MKTSMSDFNVDWKLIKNLCRTTVNKEDSQIEPNDEWKKKLLICRHSPLRVGTMTLKIEDIPYYVMGHLVRHNVGVTPYVGTSREDRTRIPRDERKQTDLVTMQLNANVEAIMNISEKRLCTCADINTLKTWKQVLETIRDYDKDIYWASVPQCVRCGGCVEPFGKCEFYKSLMKDATKEEQEDIFKRYDIYNEYRDKGRTR